jgi:amino acid adenylation domain-containing protein
VPPRSRVYVVYTSGSTGRPTGIVQSHGAFAGFVSWMADAFTMGAGRRVAQWAAPNYDAAYCEIFATLAGGGTVCPVPAAARVDAGALTGWLARQRIHVLQTVPSMARELLGRLREPGGPRPGAGLDTLLLAGEPFPGELAAGLRRALPDARLVNLYGPTETILATWHEVTGAESGPVPVGRPIPGRRVLVLDDRDRPCPPGVTGQIVIGGPGLSEGYLDPHCRPGAFEDAADPAGRRYRTGDLGRWRADGLLEFRGRADDQVKLRGTRLELSEVEAVLAGHPAVRGCAVVADRDADGLAGTLTAYVVPDPAAGLARPEQWRAHLRRRFPETLLPARFVTVPEIPRNAGGKLDRARLPEPDPADAARDAGRSPATETERRIAAVWGEVLGTDRIGAEQSFFALGGHSLVATRVLHRIRELTGAEVSLRAFFAEPTVAGLARLVDAGEDEDPELADLLREISALSDDEARRLAGRHESDALPEL